MKKLSLLFLVLFFAVGCATTSTDGNRSVMLETFQKGMAAYDRGDYSQAFGLMKTAAEAGNPNAQYYLATMYDFGRGTRTDHETANVWYLKAAEQGQDDAQYNLAISYKIGEGIEQDDNKAVYWLSKAAATGDRDAINLLTGDYAENGNAEAQYALAHIYRDGVTLHEDTSLYISEEDNSNIAPNAEQYMYWLRQAAEGGYEPAVRELQSVK